LIFCDTETFSEVPITQGLYRYAENVEVMIVTYAVCDAPVRLWDRTLDPTMPAELSTAIELTDAPVVAHNSSFDRHVLAKANVVDLPIERMRCSMTRALCHGLPGGLDILCQIFKVAEDKAKLKDGRQLMHLFTKPLREDAKNYDQDVFKRTGMKRATRNSHPEQWAR